MRLEGTDQIGCRIDDVGAESKDGIVAIVQMDGKFGRIGVEADAEQGIIFLPGGSELLDKGHTASLAFSDGKKRVNFSGSKQVCRLR